MRQQSVFIYKGGFKMSRKVGRTKDNELIKFYKSVEDNYILEIEGVTIGKFDSAAKAERVAKVEMLRSYGLNYEQCHDILDSNIKVGYDFLTEWKNDAAEKVTVRKDSDKWAVYINNKIKGKADSKKEAERLADYILISKQHPQWTVQQVYDYIDQESMKGAK